MHQRIKFVSKEANPPSVTSLRPIDGVWANLKNAVFNKNWEATSFPSLKGRIRQKTGEVSLPIILRLFNTIEERLAIWPQNGH